MSILAIILFGVASALHLIALRQVVSIADDKGVPIVGRDRILFSFSTSKRWPWLPKKLLWTYRLAAFLNVAALFLMLILLSE
ncbi:hypothetical protein [Marinicauda sp. Alg238-R41]|uniref:hypothetical protein n=1 Tax=Marinicauda sp. Alg238-R41 TaxID=2993447 RepID=UPI0022E46816|nr:hypothetical protein [Marinicauda sp. Alg238-R41]